MTRRYMKLAPYALFLLAGCAAPPEKPFITWSAPMLSPAPIVIDCNPGFAMTQPKGVEPMDDLDYHKKTHVPPRPLPPPAPPAPSAQFRC